MEITGVLASSSLDSQGERIAPEALAQFAETINGENAIPFTIGHDPTVPPIGKILRASTDQMDGETRVIGTIEIFAEPRPITLPDGSVLLSTRSDSDRRPFVRRHEAPSEMVRVDYDANNFASQEDLDSFLKALPRDLFLPRRLVRKAAIPDPLVIVSLSATAIATLSTWKLFQRTAEKLSDRIADDAVRTYEALTRSLLELARTAIPRNRPRMFLFVAREDPIVEFVIRASSDRILESINVGKWSELIAEAKGLGSLLGATQVQYLFDLDRTEWRLNYLITADGTVIGTPWSFRDRAKHLELIQEGGGLSISGSLGPDEF